MDNKIFEELDERAKQQLKLLYPSFEFKTKPAYYVSFCHLDGTPSRKGRASEQTYIYKNGHSVQDNGGASMSLFEFFCYNRNLHGDYWDNLREYARAVGYELPENENFKKRIQEEENRRQAMEQAVKMYVSARQMNQGQACGFAIDQTLAIRGWSYEYADAWRIGYDVQHPTHPLTIPVTKNGKIEQIARRVLNGTPTAQKYLNEPGKKLNYFGFAPAYAETLFICEGIADAMALNYAGFPAGCSFSNNLNQEQKEDISKRIKAGLRRVYLVADKDKAGEEATPKNGAFIVSKGCECHIITFDDCKDADDYFCKLKHTAQEFAQIVASAPAFAEYMYNRHRAEYKQTNNLNAFVSSVAQLYADTPAPADKMLIENRMQTNASADGYLQSIWEEARNGAKPNQEKKEDPKKNGIPESIQERAKQMFKPYQAGDVLKRMATFSEEIRTGYTLVTMDAQDDAQPWTIPADDLTLIAGYTSHGKTKMLQNLCLKMAYNNELKGRFLFVSYEESDGAILRQMINIRVNKTLTTNPREKTNLEAIGDYLQNKESNCNGYADDVLKTIAELDDLATRGRLVVEEINAPVDVLCESIRQQVELYKDDENPIKAVFVDYVQLLEMDGSERMTPNIVLKNIALRLHETAKQTQTAVICGAQLKREEKDKNPIFINESDVADSAYLERTSAQVVIIYDGNKLHARELSIIGGKLEQAQESLIRKGFASIMSGENRLEAPGRMYLKVCKHRGRRANVDGVLSYTPATGTIENFNAKEWETIYLNPGGIDYSNYGLSNLKVIAGGNTPLFKIINKKTNFPEFIVPNSK